MVMVQLGERGDGTSLDGHRDTDGSFFTEAENPARLFNHRLHNPNCKILKKDGKAFLQTKRHVAQGI